MGTTFLVVGCLGFVPGATADLDQIHLTGPGSTTALLGVVPVTVAGNLLHLAFAAAALLSLTSDSRARAYLVWGGSLYAALCARSLAVGTGSVGATAGSAGGVWLALGAGLAMTVVGWLTTGAVLVGPGRGGIRHPS